MGLLTNLVSSLGSRVKRGAVYAKTAVTSGAPLPSFTGAVTPTVPYSRGTGIDAGVNTKHFSDLSDLSKL